ncbi:MAG TPA: hypothetical protein VF510_04570 [Ktedonobacterales bacterium]
MVSQRTHLKKLAGEWKGSGTMTALGEAYPVRARWKNDLVAAGYALRCEMRMTGVPGAEEFVDVEQIGYDDYEQQFHAGTACIFGETHDLRGEWQDETLMVSDDRENLAVRVISPEQLNVHVENAGGGPVFDLDFEKQAE